MPRLFLDRTQHLVPATLWAAVSSTLLASAYLHRIDPVILPIAGDFAVRWYGLSYIVGFIIAWLLIRWFAKTGRSPIPVECVSDLMLAVVIGVLLGGRLGYVLFYEQSLLIYFSNQFPFWGVLMINKGGMSSHGGMIGVILACVWFARKCSIPVMHPIDVGALVATPGLFFGRIANFINGELPGRTLPDAMQANPPWWSIKYPQAMRDWSAEELARLRDLMPEVGISASEWDVFVREGRPHRGIDLLIEATRMGNETVIETLRPMLNAHYPSQIMQAITDGPVLAAVLVLVWLKPRKPGVIGGTFLIAYGVLRIMTEFFRQPDEGVALLMGLSRGQVLSVLMVLAGIGVVWWYTMRDVESIGGLVKKRGSQGATA